jgi:hypothetical protein
MSERSQSWEGAPNEEREGYKRNFGEEDVEEQGYRKQGRESEADDADAEEDVEEQGLRKNG